MPEEMMDAGDVAATGGFEEGGASHTEDKWDDDTRKYIENLRRESAGYRQRAKTYDQYFGGYSDEDRQIWFALAQEMTNNPKQAAEYLKQLGDGILSSYEPPKEVTQMEPQNNYITMEQFEQWQESQAMNNEVTQIEHEARGMGYNTESADYIQLLWTAQHQTEGDLRAAHNRLQEQRQQYIDEYLANKSQDAQRIGRAPGGQGAAPSAQRELKTWEDARAALEARIAATQ